MEAKIRVIDRPIATDNEGRVLEAGVGWYPSPLLDAGFYDSCLVGGSRPAVARRGTKPSGELLRVATEVVRRDRAIFRGLG
jgi:hypothetical protein